MSRPTENEKESCLCIGCLNSHLVLNSINKFRKSVDVHEYQSLTISLDGLSNIDKDDNSLFLERENDKGVHYYVYERKTECYKGKDGNDAQYTRTARVDKKVNSLLKNAPRYLKHRSYVENMNQVLPILKERFSRKYIELDFSENLGLRPKHEVQSFHFSGKQHSLHCVIFRPNNTSFRYHLSDDTEHNAFVEEVLRDWYSDVI